MQQISELKGISIKRTADRAQQPKSRANKGKADPPPADPPKAEACLSWCVPKWTLHSSCVSAERRNKSLTTKNGELRQENETLKKQLIMNEDVTARLQAKLTEQSESRKAAEEQLVQYQVTIEKLEQAAVTVTTA